MHCVIVIYQRKKERSIKLISLFVVILALWGKLSYAVLGGTPTQKFKPVVKLSVDTGLKSYTCTGVFIRRNILLTAAHCVKALYSLVYIRVGQNREQLPSWRKLLSSLLINQEENARVEDVFMLSSRRYIKLSQFYRDLRQVSLHRNQGILSSSTALEQSVAYSQKYLKPVNEKNFHKDIALIKVTPRLLDHVYPLAPDSLTEGEDITMIGFGHYQTKSQRKKRQQENRDRRNIKRYGKNNIFEKNAVAYNLVGSNKGLPAETHILSPWAEGFDYFAYKRELSRLPWGDETRGDSLEEGDSGGPLLRKRGDTYYVYGVASLASYFDGDIGYRVSTYVRVDGKSLIRPLIDIILN